MTTSTLLQLGTMVALEADLADRFAAVQTLGLRTCQLVCWAPQRLTPDLAGRVVDAAGSHGIEISSFWAGHSGPAHWNFIAGPASIGLVPAATRAARLLEYRRAADFAAMIGAPSMTTHVGFIAEDPADPSYAPVVDAVRELAIYCADQGVEFWFETGQETPVTLLRTIEEIAVSTVGINLDPANLILYGKGNPVDALEVFGQHVRGLHAKDGCYPTNGRELGQEVAIGSGRVDFAALLAGLKRRGFRGRVTIEREIDGEQQLADIRAAIAYLTPWL